jgi:hypothetical protein
MLALLCQILAFALATPVQALPLVAGPFAGGVPICHVHEDQGSAVPDGKAAPACLVCPICQASLHGAAPPPPAPSLRAPASYLLVSPPPAPAPHRAGTILEAAFARGPPSITSAA